MNELFLKIINMSISASWLVLAVLLLRLLFKKAPKWVNVLLWGIVAVRLICPFSFESALSLIPSAETISPTIMMDQTPTVHTGIPVINNVINPVIGESFAPAPGASANPLQIWIPILSIVWVVGVAALLLYTAVSYWRLRRKVSEAVILRDNIYQSENVGSPFVLGIIKPKVYLPYKMDEQDLGHVVAHEQAHIRRKDHWWKPLGFLLLTIHWFNPLMWLAYVLLCRDIELACDEKVIKELGNEQRADYTQALVTCSVNRRMIAACPLAFGEVGVKERVKSVMNYKKPAFWVIILAVIACVVVAVCFLTNPSNDEQYAPEPFGHVYNVEEILFDAPQYSFVYSIDTAPRYQFTSDYAMFVSENVLSQDGSMEWVQQKGGFEEVKITTENFDNYFDMSGFQISNDRWSKFRSSIKKAWRIDIENDENNVFYYLISTESGEVYLTYGYHDPEGETDPHSDDSSIRWLFKLARTDLLTCNAISVGNATEPAQENVEAEDTGEVSSSIYEIQYGNTTGNTSNNAFVAQDDENIYYLREVDPDTELQTSELVKARIGTNTESVIFSGHRLSYINIVDEWIYYIGGDEGHIYRVRKDGSEHSIVSGDLNNVNAMVVVNEYIFCRAADSEKIKALYSISLETGEVKTLCQLGLLCSGLIVNDGWIYYSVSENDEWKAYRIRTDGTENSTIGDLQLFSACIESDRIYYLDDNLQICSMGLDGAEKKLLADSISAIRINVSDGWIYYSDTAAIYRIRVDGSEKTKLCDFPSSNNISINVLGEWIYLCGDGFENQRIKAN